MTCSCERLATVKGKTSDRCFFAVGDLYRSDYVPDDVGIGGGDYLSFSYCLNCGRIQGQFPISLETIQAVFGKEGDEDESW